MNLLLGQTKKEQVKLFADGKDTTPVHGELLIFRRSWLTGKKDIWRVSPLETDTSPSRAYSSSASPTGIA